MSGGRPAFFDNSDELALKVNEYFKFLEGDFKDVEKRDEKGELYSERVYTRYPEEPTVTGLALFLGFESRQSVYDYEKNGEFSYIIKRARLFVEHGYEKALRNDKCTGAIFALKNMGWTDKQEIDHTSKDGSMSPPTPIAFTKGSN